MQVVSAAKSNIYFCIRSRLLMRSNKGCIAINIFYSDISISLVYDNTRHTVNVLKFRTLFTFSFQRKCGLSGLKFTKCLLE